MTFETSPLLHSRRTEEEQQYSGESASESAVPDGGSCRSEEELYQIRPDDSKPTQPRSGLGILFASSFPLICTYMLQVSMIAITLLFVGRLGKVELAAVSLACLTATVTGFSVFQGLASVLNTLYPQAYGAGLKRAVGLHTQRMALLLLFISIPIAFFWYFSYFFLQLLVHNDEVCKLAKDFLRILTLGCPGYACFECGKSFLRAQGHFSPGLYTFLVCIPVHACLTWLLVVHSQFGIQGAAVSLSCTRSLLPLGLVIYSWISVGGECWRKIDGKILQNWAPMIKLALPALLLVVADSIGFEILTLLAGLNGTAELGAQTLLATLCSFIFKIPFSMGIAASTQIADLPGRGSVQEAKWIGRFTLIIAGVVGSLIVVLVISLGNIIPCLFTKDEDVATLMVSAMPVLAVFTLIDAIDGVITGVLRGMGKQLIGAVIQTVGFYVIGLPCSIVAAFSLGWHLSGLWTDISIAMFFICIVEGVYIYFLDWSSFVEEVRSRNALDGET